jgi:hypothetical protein
MKTFKGKARKQKVYFSEFEEDYAYTKEDILEQMKERGLDEVEVSQAERELKSEYFFCKAAGEVGLKSEGCGKICPDYIPRNGKNGCCKHRGFCYTPGKEFILSITGKLTPCQ